MPSRRTEIDSLNVGDLCQDGGVTIEYRSPIGFTEAARLDNIGFGGGPESSERVEIYRSLFEPARSIGAYDGDELVGQTGGWTLRMRVPARSVEQAAAFGSSASLPTLGTLGVGPVVVSPTHRRRGIMSQLLRRQFAGLHDAGAEPVTALTASEPAIYGRFGYGLATEQASLAVPRTHSMLRPVTGMDEREVRFADPAGSVELVRRLQNAATAGNPGSFEHDERWIARQLQDPPSDRGGGSEVRLVVCLAGDEPTGYAVYQTRHTESGGRTDVRKVLALDLASYARLWRFLFDIDLMTTTTHHHLGTDDPLLSLLVDSRRAAVTVRDGLWVRIVDIDRALAGRTYSTDFTAVLEVLDADCPWNGGRWRLSGSRDGASCESTTDRADLTVHVRELGAAFLGRPVLSSCARAGFVEEHSKGAVATVSAAFAHDPTPWADTVF